MAKAKSQLQVTGLAEPGLVRTVEGTLSTIDGVQYAHVNLGAGKVIVEYDDDLIGVESLLAALRKAGLDAIQD